MTGSLQMGQGASETRMIVCFLAWVLFLGCVYFDKVTDVNIWLVYRSAHVVYFSQKGKHADSYKTDQEELGSEANTVYLYVICYFGWCVFFPHILLL